MPREANNNKAEDRVREALIEFKQAVYGIDSEQAHKALLTEYGVFFVGDRMNEAADTEIAASLRTHFHIQVSLEKFRAMLPQLAPLLGIVLMPMTEPKDTGENVKAGYWLVF
jgi:hypothetical protein